jgi:L-iditol 2-dehydrogenase
MFTKILQLRGVNVLSTDLLESRLKLARKFGAKWTFNAGQASRLPSGHASARDASASPMRAGGTPALHSTSFDAAIIAVPSDDAVLQALQLVRGGGQVLLFAHTKRNKSEIGNRKSENFPLSVSAFSLDLASICLDEKDLIGSYSSDFTLQAEVARLVFSRRLDVRGLISHYFPLEQTPAAIVLASRPSPDSLKILIRIH